MYKVLKRAFEAIFFAFIFISLATVNLLGKRWA